MQARARALPWWRAGAPSTPPMLGGQGAAFWAGARFGWPPPPASSGAVRCRRPRPLNPVPSAAPCPPPSAGLALRDAELDAGRLQLGALQASLAEELGEAAALVAGRAMAGAPVDAPPQQGPFAPGWRGDAGRVGVAAAAAPGAEPLPGSPGWHCAAYGGPASPHAGAAAANWHQGGTSSPHEGAAATSWRQAVASSPPASAAAASWQKGTAGGIAAAAGATLCVARDADVAALDAEIAAAEARLHEAAARLGGGRGQLC